jgi:hypothetical protein
MTLGGKIFPGNTKVSGKGCSENQNRFYNK